MKHRSFSLLLFGFTKIINWKIYEIEFSCFGFLFGQYLRIMMWKQIKYFLHSFFCWYFHLGFGNVNPLICPDLDLKIHFFVDLDRSSLMYFIIFKSFSVFRSGLSSFISVNSITMLLINTAAPSVKNPYQGRY